MNTLGFPLWVVICIIAIFSIVILYYFVYRKRRSILFSLEEIEQWIGQTNAKTEIPGLDPEWKKKPAKIKDRYLSMLTVLNDSKTDTLTDVQYILMDVDEDLKRYKFSRCMRNLEDGKRKLLIFEENRNEQIKKIRDFGEIIEEIEALKIEYGQIRQKVERRLDELRFQYGFAFHSLKEHLNRFDRESQNIKEEEDKGNFEEVRDRLHVLLEQNKDLMATLHKVPSLRQTIEKEIGQEIRQLDEDAQEMVQGGYGGDPDAIYAELVKIKGKSQKLPRFFEEGKINDTENLLFEIREDIENFYNKMEEIVTGYQQYLTYLEELPHYLKLLKDDRTYLTEELNDLSERFQVNGGEISLYNRQIDAIINEIESSLAKTAATGEKLSYLRYNEGIASIAERANGLISQRDQMILNLKEYRKGETQALEEIQQFKCDVARVEQQLKRLHLPGMPEEVKNSIESCRRSIFEVEHSLNEVPLNMEKINHYLKESRGQVINLLEKATETIQLSQNTEELIQQTNRYRRFDSEVDELLKEAEKAFRNLEFSESYQLAERANTLAREKNQ